MPEALQSFIDNALSIADKRNLAIENPVVVTIPVENAESFITVVAHLEPNHVTLPFNVTWIVADPDSPDYKKALRRVSALPFGNYRNTWAVLSTFQDILDEPQFYDFTSTFSLGEVQTTGVQPANDKVRGTFKLLDIDTNDPENPVVVGDNDPRMTDARLPTPHGHPLQPAISLQGATGINDYYVLIENSTPPQPGHILAITGPGSKSNEWVGLWRKARLSDVDYDGPTFDMLEIIGPSASIDELQTAVFRANAHFSDGSIQNNVAATWSIISNSSAATISPTTGTLTAGSITGDKVVRVQARYRHVPSNKEIIQTFDLTIIDVSVALTLVSISINGPTSVNERTQASYTVTANYDDGSSAGIVPNSFTSSNPGAGTFSSTTGVLTVPELLSNQLTTIYASYTENGVTRSTTKDVTAIDTTVYPASAVINGPTVVPEGTNATYTMTVTFTDSSSSVVAISNWASSNPEAGSINSATGVLISTSNVIGDKPTTISASYTSAGRTVSASLNVVVSDTTNYPVSAQIIGADSVNEGSTSSYSFRVTFTDSTTATVPVTNWTSSNTSYATINNTTGVLTSAGDVKPSGSTVLSASYTQHGVTVNASKTVAIVDTTIYPVSAQIVGSGTMNESTSQNLILRVTYGNGTVVDKTTNTWLSSNPSVAAVNSTTGQVTTPNIIGTQTATISCSYTENSETVVPTPLQITVVDTTVYPVSATIIGLNTVSEGTTTTYSLRVVFDDGTNSIQPTTNWAIDNSSAGTINASTGVFTAAPGLTSNVNATISASFTRDGTTVNASLPITVTDDTIYPASAIILGPSSVDENTTANYTMQVTFTNATVGTVTVSNWATSNASASINANTGLLTANDVVGNQSCDVTASYTSNGVTVSASLLISIVDTTNYPVSATIIGLASVAEANTTTYQFQVTYTDGSNVVVSPTDWASSNTSIATINATTGSLQAAANVVGNQTINISASFTQHGTTVNASRTITISDTTIYPVSAEIIGSSSVNESTSQTYSLLVTFSDSSQSTVVVNNWSSTNSAAGIINANTGVFIANANDTKANIATTISCSYTVDGTTVSPSPLVVNVIDTTNYPASARIVGASAVAEGSQPTEYQFEVTYTDNTISIVTVSNWASSNTAVATIDSSGQLTPAADLPADDTTTISASYTESGDTVSATLDVTVTDQTNYPATLTIDGLSSISEGEGSTTYTATVTYMDSTTSVVAVTDWALSGSASVVGTIDSSGLLTLPADVIGNQNTVISCSYTESGVTVNATFMLTIIDDIVKPASASIIGPSTIDETLSANYVFRVTYDNGSINDVSVSDWSSDNTSVATIDANTGLCLASSVDEDIVVNIGASYTSNGVTVNASLPLTIVDTTNYPMSATILGSATMEEGDAATYQLLVTYKDSTTSVVAVTDWASSDTNVATIDANTGLLTSNSTIVGNQVTTISASYTEFGRTVNASKNISVIDIDNAPVSVVITGPATVDENTVANFTATVTYQDSTTVDQTLSLLGTWSVSNATVGTIGTNNGQFNALEVNSDVPTDITFYFTQYGATVEDTISINVIDVFPTSLAISGPNTANEAGASINLTATVTYNNGSTENVTTSSSWSSDNTFAATVGASSGIVNPGQDVIGDTPVVISASFTSDSVTVNATHNITIVETVKRPISVAITGPSAVDEGSSINLVATVTYDDTTTAVVTTNANGTWSSSNTSVAAIDSSGVLTTSDVTGNENINALFSYSENSVTVDTTYPITVNDVSIPESAEISGPTAAIAGDAPIQFTATVTFSDSSSADKTTEGTWSSSNPAAGTINPTTGVFTPIAS